MTIVTSGAGVRSGAAGGAGRYAGFVRSLRGDTSPPSRLPRIQPEDGPEGIDERLLREHAERARCERLHHFLQRPSGPRRVGVP